MACKYTYGGQEYDSLDDLKAAVKNDLQRSADKEEVVDKNELQKQNLIPLTSNFTRESVKNDIDYIYLFTDNAKRTSGKNSIEPSSWYRQKYTTSYPLNFPSMTQAVARGLNNAFPITTMVDDNRTQWKDSQFDEYKKIIDDEINTIKGAQAKFKGIKFAAQNPFGQGKISNMKQSAPKIWNYLNEKLAEIGIDNTGEIPKVKNISQVVDKNQLQKQIDFQEEPTTGYRQRTINNAKADATIAIAVDFTSAGEKLTKTSVLNQNKKYIPIDANTLTVTKERVDKIVEQLNSVNAKTLNIAGNGIYTMKGKYTQQQIDDFTYDLLNQVLNSPNLKTKIESIRSGGQTGFDEAGAKAGIKLGLHTIVLAPKGWTFRNINGQDISNEQQFKDRFKNISQVVDSGIDENNLNPRIKKAIDDIKTLIKIGENPNELLDFDTKLDKNKIIFAPIEGKKTIEPEHISLPEKYRGKGLGVALYILKGEQAKQKGKVLINSDGFKPEAAKVWIKLVNLGLATQAGKYATFEYTGLTGKELEYFKNNYKNKPISIERNFVELENNILDFEPKVQKLFNAPTVELYDEVIGNYEYDLSADIDNNLRKVIESKLRDVKKSFTVTKPQQKITDEEVEAMTEALVEMYPEIEFAAESNPNFVDKEGVFNQIEDNDFINLVTHDNLLTGNIVIGDSFATFTLDLKAGELKDISLAKELQGKGIGSDIYLKLNALLNRKGMVLKSSDNLSKASEALWESLYKKGYVEKTPAKIKRNYEDIIQEGVTDLSGKIDIVDGFTYKFKDNQQNVFNQRITEQDDVLPNDLSFERVEGVSELFESNPELANAVYEALGSRTLENSRLENDIKELIKGRENIPSSIFLSYLIDNNLIPKIQEYITSISSRHGEWNSLYKRITLDFSPINTKSEKSALIAHELMHALSSKYITSYEAIRQPDFKEYIERVNKNEEIKGTGRKIEVVTLTKEQLDAFDNLVRIKEKVFNFIKAGKFIRNEKLEKADFGSLTYAFSDLDKKENIHEFISEVFSKPILIDVLKQIPTEGKKSNLFKEFIKALKIILGFNNESIIEDILYYSEKAFINEAIKESNNTKQQAKQLYQQYLESLNKPNTNPILQNNQQEQVKKFAELQERLNNKEFLEGAKNAYENSEGLKSFGTQEQYNDYIARVSLGIIKNPSSGEYNYTSKIKDIVYHGTSDLEGKTLNKKQSFKKYGGLIPNVAKIGFWFSKEYDTAMLFGLDALQRIEKSTPKRQTFKEYKRQMQSYYDKYPASESTKLRDYNENVKWYSDEPYVLSAVLNVKNLKQFSNNQGLFDELTKSNRSDTGAGNSLIYNRGSIDGLMHDKADLNYEGYKRFTEKEGSQILIFEPEQIHILGSKQDIEGFKEFIASQQNVFNQQSRDLKNIQFQKDTLDTPAQTIKEGGKSKIIGQADIQARKVLIDAAFKNKPDLVSHEFAHHYIAWFRNTPLVQQGIKMYGSEEALVQAIGEQAVVQRGKAWSWWKKFVAWLLNSANDVSDLTKENLRDILTDAFLSRQDLNKQAGTSAGVTLAKNVAVLGGETYLWNTNEDRWEQFTKSEVEISYSDKEMQALIQEERDAVKNDATMNFYQEDFDKMEAAGLIQFKNMYGDAKTFRYNKTSDAWYDVTSDNRSSVRTDIKAIEYEWYSAIEAADSYSWKNNTMQQLQNKQLNIHKSIALNRVNRYNLLATINTSITNDITSVLDISAKQKNSGAVVDPKTNIIAAITMVGSKQGVGNMANAISGRSVLMPINAHTEPSFYYSVGDEVVKNKPLPVYLAPFGITEELFINDDGEEDLAYSFGSLVDSQIRSVMFHLSEYLTLQVDAVKDPVAVALGYIKANLNLVSYLCSLGVTPERIAQFLAEPGSSGTQVNRNNVITVWHDATESNENSFHKGKFFKTYKPSDYDGRPGYTTTTFIEKSNYKLKMEFVDNELKKSSTYKGVDVKQAYINKIVDGGRELAYHLNYEAIIRDGVDLLAHPALKILYYWDLIEQAKQYAKSVKIINADGHHSKSMNNAVEHQNNVREQIDNPKASVIRTSDLKKIISGEQSIVSGFFNAQKKYEEYFKKYFFSYERNIAPQLNKALKDRYNKSSEDALTRLMSDAHNDFLVYLFFRMQNIDPSLSSILAKDEDGNILTPKELMYSDNDNPSEVSKLYTALTAISKPKNNRRPIVDPKYSGITRSTAAMLLKLLDTQLNITDARLLKDGQGVDTQSTLVDLIKLGEKISSAPTVNKYIEMFEELRNNSPEVFKIFTSLSLFQSGISNSPYNLFKGMPNTTKTKDGIIDILAKTVIAYDKFIDNSVAAGVIEAPSGWTPQQIATATLINDFLRWYDVQYGSYLLESDRKAYHTTSKAYRKFDSSTLKYEVRVKKGEKPDKSDLVVSMGRSKYVREFFKNVDNTYTVSEVEDIQEDAVAALGVLERYAKNLIEAGVEVNKLCQ